MEKNIIIYKIKKETRMRKIKLVVITVGIIVSFAILYLFVSEVVERKTAVDKAITEIFR